MARASRCFRRTLRGSILASASFNTASISLSMLVLIEMSHLSYERQIQLPVQALHFLTPLDGNRIDVGQNGKQCEMISLADGQVHAGQKGDHLIGFIVAVRNHDGRMAHPLTNLGGCRLIKVISFTRFVAKEKHLSVIFFDQPIQKRFPRLFFISTSGLSRFR